MAGGGPGNPVVLNVFEARLDTSGADPNNLTLVPYGGDRIEINGIIHVVPPAGDVCGIGASLITAAGLNSGAPAVANTLYYAYISNSKATFDPNTMALSATPPTLVNGVKYLGNVGNALNWRFVGWVRTNATPQFESSKKKRFIVNQYNRLCVDLFTCPEYVDDNAATTYTFTGTVYAPINGGVDDSVSFISTGEDAFSATFNLFFTNTIAGVGGRLGIGVNSTTSPRVSQVMASGGGDVASVALCEKAPEGLATLSMLCVCPSGGTSATILADLNRDGAAADPAVTYITATVFV